MSGISAYNVERKQGFVWATLPESLTVDNYIAIENAIKPFLSGANDNLVLDFSKTEHVYSSGIGMLVRLHKMISQVKGTFNLVNVSEKLRKLFAEVRLDRIFKIYATDVEFEISREEIWNDKLTERKTGFLFIVNVEDGIYRVVLSGNMDTVHDLTEIRKFKPDSAINKFVIDLRSLDVMDTCGFQAFIELIRGILEREGKCTTYGANEMVREFLLALSTDYIIKHCNTEKEALEWIKRY
jgi:anti-anti-sigma factor